MQRSMLTIAFSILLSISQGLYASSNLAISHNIVSSQPVENGYMIVLDISITNPTHERFKHLRLNVDGAEFFSNSVNQSKYIGSLTPNEIKQDYWTVYTTVEPEYFISTLPIQITGTALLQGEVQTDLNLYSVLRGE